MWNLRTDHYSQNVTGHAADRLCASGGGGRSLTGDSTHLIGPGNGIVDFAFGGGANTSHSVANLVLTHSEGVVVHFNGAADAGGVSGVAGTTSFSNMGGYLGRIWVFVDDANRKSANDVFNLTVAEGDHLFISGGGGEDVFNLAFDGQNSSVSFSFHDGATTGMVADFTNGVIANDGFGFADQINVQQGAIQPDLNITATSFADSINGSERADYFYMLAGDDSVTAGDGADEVWAGSGADSIQAGAGADTIYGGAGADLISGDAQGDALYGDDGHDTILGGNGIDAIYGDAGDDVVRGGTMDDVIHGGIGNDALFGNRHNDLLDGGAGDDLLNGGGNNDTLSGGSGDDTLKGGAGADVFVFDDGLQADVILDFDMAEDVIQLSSDLAGGQTAADIAAGASVFVDGVLINFGNGDTILLNGLTSTIGLDAAIDIA